MEQNDDDSNDFGRLNDKIDIKRDRHKTNFDGKNTSALNVMSNHWPVRNYKEGLEDE